MTGMVRAPEEVKVSPIGSWNAAGHLHTKPNATRCSVAISILSCVSIRLNESHIDTFRSERDWAYPKDPIKLDIPPSIKRLRSNRHVRTIEVNARTRRSRGISGPILLLLV